MSAGIAMSMLAFGAVLEIALAGVVRAARGRRMRLRGPLESSPDRRPL
jgi:hypothetical protein